jgi:hypothetical protein
MKAKMKNHDMTDKPKRKVKKVLLIGALSLAVVLLISHFVWKNSGSNEWTLAKDENGIKIWTLKTPGTCLKKVKVNMKLHSRLADILTLLESDATIGELGIRDWKIFDKVEAPSFYSAYYSYKIDIPFPIGTRDFVLLFQHSQDPKTKIVEVNVLASPGKTHPIKNCERITHLNDIYRLTPLGNGEIEFEVIADFDVGGSIPYFIKNLVLTDVWNGGVSKIRELLSQEKYKNAKINNIVE